MYKENMSEDSSKVESTNEITMEIVPDETDCEPDKSNTEVVTDTNENFKEDMCYQEQDIKMVIDMVEIEPQRTALVYTTRLERMSFMNSSVTRGNVPQLFDDIIEESKPILKSLKDRDRFKKSSQLHKKLVKKIQDINSIVIEKRNRSAVVQLNYCRPFVIDLDEVPKSKNDWIQFKLNRLNSIKSEIKKYFESHRNNKNKLYFLFINEFTNMTDVYLVGNQKVTEYYRIKNEDLFPVKGRLFRITLLYCCWYDRELKLKLFFNHYVMNIPSHLKIPHDCVGSCKCCCSRHHRVDNISQQEDSTQKCNYRMGSRKDRISYLIEKSPGETCNSTNMSVINKALRFIPKISRKIAANFKQIEKTAPTTILFKDNKTNECTYYRIGEDGQLDTYLKPYKSSESINIDMSEKNNASREDTNEPVSQDCTNIDMSENNNASREKNNDPVSQESTNIDMSENNNVSREENNDPVSQESTNIDMSENNNASREENNEPDVYTLQSQHAKEDDIDQSEIKYEEILLCWFTRQKILSKLLLNNIPEHVINFLKTSHACPPGNCDCCCQSPNTNQDHSSVDVHISNLPTHTKSITSTSRLTLKFGYVPSVCNIPMTPRSLKRVQSNIATRSGSLNKTKNHDISVVDLTYDQDNDASRSIDLTKDINTLMTNTSRPIPPLVYYNPNKSKANADLVNKTTPKSSTHNLPSASSNTSFNSANAEVLSEMLPSTSTTNDSRNKTIQATFIDNILKRFKAVRLGVDEKGNVNITNPENKAWSPEDVKILENIHRLAQKEVDASQLKPASKIKKNADNRMTTELPIIIQSPRSFALTDKIGPSLYENDGPMQRREIYKIFTKITTANRNHLLLSYTSNSGDTSKNLSSSSNPKININTNEGHGRFILPKGGEIILTKNETPQLQSVGIYGRTEQQPRIVQPMSQGACIITTTNSSQTNNNNCNKELSKEDPNYDVEDFLASTTILKRKINVDSLNFTKRKRSESPPKSINYVPVGAKRPSKNNILTSLTKNLLNDIQTQSLNSTRTGQPVVVQPGVSSDLSQTGQPVVLQPLLSSDLSQNGQPVVMQSGVSSDLSQTGQPVVLQPLLSSDLSQNGQPVVLQPVVSSDLSQNGQTVAMQPVLSSDLSQTGKSVVLQPVVSSDLSCLNNLAILPVGYQIAYLPVVNINNGLVSNVLPNVPEPVDGDSNTTGQLSDLFDFEVPEATGQQSLLSKLLEKPQVKARKAKITKYGISKIRPKPLRNLLKPSKVTREPSKAVIVDDDDLSILGA